MLKLLKNFRWYYWLFCILIIGFVYLQVAADLKMPDYLTKILNNAGLISKMREYGVTVPAELLVDTKSEIYNSGLKMLLCSGISVVSTVIVSFLAAKIAAGFSHDLRDKVYNKVQNFSLNEIDSFSTSSLITRSTNDITQIQMVIVMVLRIAVSAPIMAIKGIIQATKQASSSNLNSIVIISVIALVLLVFIIFIFVMPKFKQIQGLTDKLNLVTRENLTGIRVVRANNAQGYEEEKFSKVNNDVTKMNVFVNRMMSLLNPGMMIIMNGTSLCILWVGAYAINNNVLNIGDVFGFQQYAMIICMAFMQLIMIFVMVPRGMVSAKRINEVLDSKNLISEPEHSTKPLEKGSIEFKNVSFMYPGSNEPVLSNISFKIENGETLAIIGSTGSGKSTILNLINRFYDATSGSVLVDGVDVKEYKEKDLEAKLGLVPQKSNLFRGTIKSNLEYGKENPTAEEITNALTIAQAYDFVSNLDLKENSVVAQGGTNFSGGQKQRLCIARAIIKKPEIFLFDDSFSALDLKTDQELRLALKNMPNRATNVIVAQRIGTIINADKIIVLDKGEVVGIGTHKELLANCSVYQEIAYSQLSKEELENA